MLRTFSRITLALALAIGGIVAACRHEVPVPTVPFAPEVSRRSPRPPTIDPSHRADAGVDSSGFGHAYVGHRAETVRVADVPSDAGISDVMNLPPVPDADTDLVSDAGQRL